ncbi:MAG: ACP S-malonyltransferase [Candidatus Marinimicrobia bacterium]|nr:ACP S-malonyltransferase [Candidatus Neomarinimicrobiota bacterium]
MNTAWLFPGQASQKVGMGHDLYQNTELGKSYFDLANSIMGVDIQSIIFEGPQETLKQTQYTQPAIYIVSVIIGKLLLEKGLRPTVLAGHSLGEYSALAIGEAFDFPTGLNLVKLRAENMALAGRLNPGSMAAIIGLDEKIVIDLCQNYPGEGIVVAANFNSPRQVIISGTSEAVTTLMATAKSNGARMTTLLNVSGAFHSPLMASAREALAVELNSIQISDSIYPIYANVNAQPNTLGVKIKDLLIRQLENPVLWSQTVSAMSNEGIESFMEVGPGKVLQGLNKRINRQIPVSGIESITQLEALNV